MNTFKNSTQRRFPIRLWAIVLCLFFAVPISVIATTLEDLEAQREQLEQQNSELWNEISRLEGDEQSARERQEAVAAQIEVVQRQIDNTLANIAAHDREILALSEKIAAAQVDIQDTMEQLKVRIRTLYTTGGDIGTLEILLNAESLHDFSLLSEMLKSVAKHDKMLIEKISQYMRDTQDERDAIEEKKAELAQLKTELDAKNAELNQLNEENAALIEELQLEQEDTMAAILKNEQEGAAVISQIEEIIAERAAREQAEREAAQRAWEEEQERLAREAEERRQEQLENGVDPEDIEEEVPDATPPSFNTDFYPCWPLPGGSITCHYGNGHNGLDIAGPYGSTIVAAEAGEVIVANNYDSWGDSWGYYVLIYHNSRYTTRYAHCSSILVSNGQFVEKGQAIAIQGNTGYSFGDHLHFEVYQDGWRVNPYQFF